MIKTYLLQFDLWERNLHVQQTWDQTFAAQQLSCSSYQSKVFRKFKHLFETNQWSYIPLKNELWYISETYKLKKHSDALNYFLWVLCHQLSRNVTVRIIHIFVDADSYYHLLDWTFDKAISSTKSFLRSKITKFPVSFYMCITFKYYLQKTTSSKLAIRIMSGSKSLYDA